MKQDTYTYFEVIRSLAEKLTAAGIDNAEWEAKELAGCALGFDCRRNFDGMKTAAPEQISQCAMLLTRRESGEPLQYIIGQWDFCGRTFEVGPGVLIPRADTETLIDTALRKFKGRQGLTVIDLCAGTGCIGITLAKELDCAEVYCVEKYDPAYFYLVKNNRHYDDCVKPVQGDVTERETALALPAADLIISNPPYISDEDMRHLQREVRCEPATALAGGEDGCGFYRDITRIWSGRLKPDGMLIYEIGMGQEEEVMQIMIQAGLKDVRVRKDMSGVNRCVIGRKIETENVNLYEQLEKRGNT